MQPSKKYKPLNVTPEECIIKFFQFQGYNIKKLKKLIPEGWRKTHKNYKMITVDIDIKKNLQWRY